MYRKPSVDTAKVPSGGALGGQSASGQSVLAVHLECPDLGLQARRRHVRRGTRRWITLIAPEKIESVMQY